MILHCDSVGFHRFQKLVAWSIVEPEITNGLGLPCGRRLCFIPDLLCEMLYGSATVLQSFRSVGSLLKY